MRKKTTFIALLVSVFMLFSLGGQSACEAYVLDKDEVTAQPDKDDVIPDPMLNWVIRTSIKKTPDRSYAKLTKEDLTKDLPKYLSEIYYSESDHYDLYEFNVFVKSIEGLQYATNTERILLPYNLISDLKPIANLTKLTKIVMNDNPISDLTPLSNLTNLKIVRLGDNKITNIEPLAKLTELESLNLELNSKISDISVVRNFPKLKYLNVGNNSISDITCLKDLTNIEDGLILENNKIKDISSLANMKKLKELDISSNNISDISVLKNLRNLKILRLSNNSGINDITPLTNLTQLDKNELWLGDTGIADKKDDLFKVIDVNKLINKFKANDITLDDKEYVAAARTAYNSLSPDLQKYIPEVRITDAEKNTAKLEKGEEIKHYDELNEFDKQSIELGDFKTLQFKVEDKNGQPLSGVKFNLQTKYGYTQKELTSDENGVVKYSVSVADQYMDYQIVLVDKDKYDFDIEKIIFKTDGIPKITELNGQPATGREKLKVVLTAKSGDATTKVDKTNLEKAIKELESRDASIYTEESYKQLADELVSAKAILTKADATQEEVNTSTKNVEEAMKKLVEKSTQQDTVPSNTLQIKTVDKNGKPISGVKFNINDQNDEAIASLTSDEDGIARYKITMNMTYMEFAVDIADKNKYTSETEKITLEIGTNPEIIKINKKAFTGKENLKFVITVNGEDIVTKVDKTSLEEAIKEAESKEASKYTEESYKQLIDALVSAKTILAKADATQEEVNTSTKNVQGVIAKLVEKSTQQGTVSSNTLQIKTVDKNGKPISGVKFNINDQNGEAITSLTSDESGIAKYIVTRSMTYMEFTVDIADKNKYTSETEKITLEIGSNPEIVKINKKAFTGKENLKFVITVNGEDISTKVDNTSLEKAIKDAESKEASKYTEESYRQLTDVLVSAKATLIKADATQEEINTSTKNVGEAIARLVEKSAQQQTTKPGGGKTEGTKNESNSKPTSVLNTVKAKVIDSKTGKSIEGIEAKVTTETNGTKTVAVKSSEVIVLKQPNGKITVLTNLSKLGFKADTNSNVGISADGTIQVKNLANGTESKIDVTYDLGNGQKITIGKLDVRVASNGEVSLASDLIDPYGVITDAATGKIINGANVTLYYANTERNKKLGKTPDALVKLPIIEGFKPHDNKNPQNSNEEGSYGFMVFPTTDYYIVAKKAGYDTYTSPIISVEQEIVKHDFEMNLQNSGVKRLAGKNRVDTAIEIAKATFKGKVKNVVIATSENYPDALAGTVLAYKNNAPMLLVGRCNSDTQKVISYIKDNMETNGTVFILGGTGAVSSTVEQKIKASGVKVVKRISAANRYEMSAKIADSLEPKKGGTVVIASGESFADALSISSVAAVNQYPILLVGKNQISQSIKNKLAELKPSKVLIIGAQGAISKAVENQLSQITASNKADIVRIGGINRFETSIEVAKNFNLSGNNICVATGDNLADVLGGSIYAAKNKANIIFVNNSLTDNVKSYLKNPKLSGVTIFGGTGVVNTKVQNEISRLLNK